MNTYPLQVTRFDSGACCWSTRGPVQPAIGDDRSSSTLFRDSGA